MSQISMEECDQKKYKGRAEIHGKIYLDQFFSAHKDGVGDADTIRIVLSSDSIKYRPSENDKWQRGLNLFNNAYYYDEQEGNRKKVIIKDGKYYQDYIRIRLQGIDSPELHYKASQGDQFLYDNQLSKFKCLNDIFEFRQHFGARAAKELVELLKGYAKEENKRKFLYAYAFSLIDTPSNLFDRFGRAVADVVVSPNKTDDISDDKKMHKKILMISI